MLPAWPVTPGRDLAFSDEIPTLVPSTIRIVSNVYWETGDQVHVSVSYIFGQLGGGH